MYQMSVVFKTTHNGQQWGKFTANFMDVKSLLAFAAKQAKRKDLLGITLFIQP